MKVYLAATFELKELMRERREELRALGIRVTSEWLDEPWVAGLSAPVSELPIIGARDVRNVLDSDVLVEFTDVPSPRGGRHVEFGLALAFGLMTVVCGPQENVFHYLQDPASQGLDGLDAITPVVHLNSWQETKDYLVALAEKEELLALEAQENSIGRGNC